MAINTDNPESTYKLTRDVKESKRLNNQHHVYTNHLGFLIHPSIPTTSPTLKIADIGTGTGIWLLSVAKTLPETCNFSGFDLSTSQFPPIHAIPQNMQFYSQNVLDPFPLVHLGSYDIVAVRLLSIVLAGTEWEAAVKNLVTLLKPGGYLQWVDTDFSQEGMGCISSLSPSPMARAIQAYHTYVHKSERYCNDPRRLIQIFKEEQGLEAVEGMLVPNDRTVASRREFSRASIPVCKFGLVMGLGMGEAEAEEEERKMFAEAEDGSNYYTYDIYVAIGRKKGGL